MSLCPREEWLDSFNTFSIYEISRKSSKLWDLNMEAHVEFSKKNKTIDRR